MLDFADVRIIASQQSGCINVTTSDRTYALTRSCLLTLKDEAGLPVSLHSEEVAAFCKNIRESQNTRGNLVLISGGDLPDRYENRFILPVWQINIGKDDLETFANEIAERLRQLGLTCKVL